MSTWRISPLFLPWDECNKGPKTVLPFTDRVNIEGPWKRSITGCVWREAWVCSVKIMVELKKTVGRSYSHHNFVHGRLDTHQRTCVGKHSVHATTLGKRVIRWRWSALHVNHFLFYKSFYVGQIFLNYMALAGDVSAIRQLVFKLLWRKLLKQLIINSPNT